MIKKLTFFCRYFFGKPKNFLFSKEEITVDRKKALNNTIIKTLLFIVLAVTSTIVLVQLFNGVVVDRIELEDGSKELVFSTMSLLTSKILVNISVVLLVGLISWFVTKFVVIFKQGNDIVVNNNKKNSYIENSILALVLIINIFLLFVFPVDLDKYNMYSFGLSVANVVIIITMTVVDLYLLFAKEQTSSKISVQVMAEGSVLAALAIVLSLISKIIPGLELPMGGSFSLSMLPIFIFGFRRGAKAGLLMGLVYSVVNMITDGSAVVYHLGVPFMDYLLPFGAIGLIAGLFSKKAQNGHITAIIYGVLIGGTVRYIFHGFSGVLFFSEVIDEGSFFFSFVTYNLPYMAVSTAGTLVVTILLRKNFIYLDTRIR